MIKVSICKPKQINVRPIVPGGPYEDDNNYGKSPYINQSGSWMYWDDKLKTFVDSKVAASGVQGPQGQTGQPGYTPQKGIDYFDGEKGQRGQPGIQGEKGQKGNDGYSPVKGIDYFDGYSPVKGVDYFDGYTPVKGVDYFDGYTPQKGIDYFDGEPGKNAQLTAQSITQALGYTPANNETTQSNNERIQNIQNIFVTEGQQTILKNAPYLTREEVMQMIEEFCLLG